MTVQPLSELNPDCLMIEDVADLAAALRTLTAYVDSKYAAMSNRLAGRIAQAFMHECNCETLYIKLPEAWRW